MLSGTLAFVMVSGVLTEPIAAASAQANFNSDEEIQNSISEYQLVSNGDDIYIFYTNYDSLAPKDFSVELFGVVY